MVKKVYRIRKLKLLPEFKRIQTQSIIRFFILFVLISTALSSFTFSGFIAYSQSNQTEANSLPSESNDKITSDKPEKVDENGNRNIDEGEGSIDSENSPLENESDNDNQNGSDESSNNQTSIPPSLSKPNSSCFFDPSQPKCAPDENGNCEAGLYMNESNQCVPNEIRTDPCEAFPNLKGCGPNNSTDENQTTSKAYDSGYDHGCDDAKISDPGDRYINHPGKGPDYHTSEFMDGYNDGFADCIKPENKSPVADAGPTSIKVIEGKTVTLDASKSYDPDGQIVKYEWQNGDNVDPGCPYGTLVNANSPTPQFIAPENIQSDCSNFYEVTVTDSEDKRGVDAILITVTTTSNSSKEVVMSNVHTSPSVIHVGEKFGIVATITNNLDKSIRFFSPDCAGKTLDVKLDKKVDRDKEIAVCQMVQDYTLGPNESGNVGSGVIQYIATESGTINTQVIFHYTVDNTAHEITKSLSFEILPRQVETPPNDNNSSDTNFDRFPKAMINGNGDDIEIDYYVLYGDDGHRIDYNNNADGITDLQLYRNQMPGPIDDSDGDSDGEEPKDVRLVFDGCQDSCDINEPDGIVVYLVPSQWSDKQIAEKIINKFDSDISNYKVEENRCTGTEPLKECSFDFNVESYKDGTNIDNGRYKLVINPGMDEEDLIYINEIGVSTTY